MTPTSHRCDGHCGHSVSMTATGPRCVRHSSHWFVYDRNRPYVQRSLRSFSVLRLQLISNKSFIVANRLRCSRSSRESSIKHSLVIQRHARLQTAVCDFCGSAFARHRSRLNQSQSRYLTCCQICFFDCHTRTEKHNLTQIRLHNCRPERSDPVVQNTHIFLLI